MRVHIKKAVNGQHEIVVVLPPSRRMAPLVLRAGSREAVVKGFVDALPVLRPDKPLIE